MPSRRTSIARPQPAGEARTALAAVAAAVAAAPAEERERVAQQGLGDLLEPWQAGRAPDFAPDRLAELLPDLLDRGARKRAGTWFTDAGLAGPIVARTLGPLLDGDRDPRTLRIVDPAVGCGAFLLAALRFLGERTGLPRTELARCLHGVDLEPLAAALAAWCVWQAIGDPALPIAAVTGRIRCGDGLLDPAAGTFDAVLGNPPWETLQPSRKEFFGALLADHGGLGARTAARREQDLLAADADAASRWQSLQQTIAARAAVLRRHFRHQGPGKLHTYRLFTEQAMRLLRPGGRLGLLLPASLYFDRDAQALRELLLDQCRWEELAAFENRRGLFPIDRRYRFAVVIAQQGGTTTALRASFGHTEPEPWADGSAGTVSYPRQAVPLLSPHSGTLVELTAPRDLAVLQRLHRHGAPFLIDAGGPLRFSQGDFNMTADARHFVGRDDAEARGWRCGDDGRWRQPGAGTLRGLLQGGMVWDFRATAGAHAGGAGHRTRWRDAAPGELRPQFLVADDAMPERADAPRVLFRTISNATNERSAVVALATTAMAAGNSLGVLTPADDDPLPLTTCAFACGVMGSLVYDWALRLRLVGTNLNRFVLADTVWPRVEAAQRAAIAQLALRLAAVHPWDHALWRLALAEGLVPAAVVATPAERSALRMRLDLLVARAFGLGGDDLRWILRDCDRPVAALRTAAGRRDLPGKGFWRIDRALPPTQRHPVRVLGALAAPAAPASPQAARDESSRRT